MGTLHRHFIQQRLRDPAQVLLGQKAFEREMVKKFKRIQRLIHDLIGTRNALDLPTSPKTNAAGDFAFKTSGQKVSAFMDWLQDEIDKDILEVRRGEKLISSSRGRWSDLYIGSSYKKGVSQAIAQLKKAKVKAAYTMDKSYIDTVLLTPIHADKVGLLFTRTFNELKGITSAMSQGISRSLAESLAEGRDPFQAARILEKRVDDIGIVRARMLARTEFMRAQHVATINTYREAGIEGVTVQAEWITADDDKVCTECEELSQNSDGSPKVYTLDEIEPLIPVHPNCRCAAIPVINPNKMVPEPGAGEEE